MYYNKDTYSLYYEKYGNKGKNILILPGWGNTRNTFNNIINYFKSDYQIYIVDFPGFGNSPFPDYDLTIYDYTNMIRDFIKDNKIVKPIIIAHSFGGRIATLISAYYKDDVEKLIMIDTAGIKNRKNIFKLLKQTCYKILKKLKIFLPKRKQSLYLKKLTYIFGSSDFKKLNINMQTSFKNIVNEDLKAYIPYIDNDTLIIWGQKDKDTPVKNAIYMKKKIKKSILVIYKNADHYSYLRQPDLTNQLISDFLEIKI